MRNFIVVHTNNQGTVKAVARIRAKSMEDARRCIFKIAKDLKVPGIELQIVDTLDLPLYTNY